MIPEAEIRRMAASLRVDPMIVDLDYVIGCFLATLYRRAEAGVLCFKGGTCLRKCYYPDYRFSEDLDFTVAERLRREELEKLLHTVVREASDQWQIDFDARPLRVDVVGDEYGRESYQVRVYYRGPLRRTGDPRAIRVDVTTSEVIAFPPSRRSIIHPYSDRELLAEVKVSCYDLLEMLAEKTRALGGQRTYAISRDVFDIYQLTTRQTVDVARLAAALPAKCKVKEVKFGEADAERLEERREDFRRDWERNLLHLVPSEGAVDFDVAWDAVKAFLDKVHRASAGSKGNA